MDNGFYGGHFGVGELGKLGGDLCDVEAVGDPGIGIDFPFLDHLDDVFEIVGEGVA